MNRNEWERIICSDAAGLYESNYLKANSPDGRWGLWIKHNLLRPLRGDAIAEFWFVLSQPDGEPIVAKKEIPWDAIHTSADSILIESDTIRLTAAEASGVLADVRWKLRLSRSDSVLFHFPWDWMYRAAFPKKKAITPAPHLQFDGEIHIAGKTIQVRNWHGLRGHNWGKEHAWTYAYGNCHLWNDGERRTVDGFSAKINLGAGFKSPWLSSAVARNPGANLNTPSHWFNTVQLEPTRWELQGRGYTLRMSARPDQLIGLRYTHPNGTESYCYNTKFASVSWQLCEAEHTSSMGEFETLFPNPVPGIVVHPSPGWEQSQGDYRS